jgi:dTDP-4-dehydrorhamnose 3,5-epimerase
MPPVQLIETRRFADSRGWFSETFSESAFAARGLEGRFVQDNHSLSVQPLTIRGLHFQKPPFAQAKLVRCVRGSILDVAVDIRNGSPTYGKWVGAELSAANGRQLFVPVGFAHGFITLEPETEVIYKVTAPYAPTSDAGLRWDDPAINIVWPMPKGAMPVLSPKDAALPLLVEFVSPFTYEGDQLEAMET